MLWIAQSVCGYYRYIQQPGASTFLEGYWEKRSNQVLWCCCWATSPFLCKRGIGAYACTYIWAFIIHVLSTVAHVALRIGRLQAGYISTVLFCRYDSLRWHREGGCDADDLVCRKLDWGGWDRVAAWNSCLMNPHIYIRSWGYVTPGVSM